MGNNVSLLKYAPLIVLFCTSCVKEKDLYEPSGKNPDDTEELDLSFKFSLRTDKQIGVMATSADEKVAEGILIGIYPQQPYEEDGTIVIKPLYVGYTDVDGCIYAIISVPVNVDKVYITSLTAGFPGVQEVDVQPGMTCVLSAVPFQVSTNASTRMAVARSGAELEIPVSQKLSNLYELYSPYADAEVGKDGIPLLNASPLVSKEELSPKFLNRVNSWYPEQKNVQDVDLNKSSDLVVTDELGAEVWATYVGDGGFYVNNRTVYNVLTYYSYKEGELNKREDIQGHRMTLLLPNTHQEKCPSGLKVQLLYWDGNKYDTIFPKGTRIGFAVARDGLNMTNIATGGVNSKSAYKFQNQTFPNANVNGFYYSTPTLNTTKKTNAVIRSMSDYNCCIMGFDIRPYGDAKADYDFNDVMVKVTATPEKAIKPGEDIPVDEDVTVAESIHGTLAFEDQWPNPGDYDLNDFVVNYTYGVYKNVDNKINGIQMRFRPIAKGAASYTKIGFGIELPLASNDIDVAEVEGAILESGDSNATFIIWEDISKPFAGGETGFINTEKGSSFVSAEELVVTIPLKAVTSNVSMMKFNPFIFVNKRSHEIHLTDFAPTSKMDMNLLGNGKDCSDVSKGIYFRMKDMYCWALDFPRTSADEAAWRYPKEKSSVVKAYKNYNKWVTNKTDLSWFDSTIPGNVDGSELY